MYVPFPFFSEWSFSGPVHFDVDVPWPINQSNVSDSMVFLYVHFSFSKSHVAMETKTRIHQLFMGSVSVKFPLKEKF